MGCLLDASVLVAAFSKEAGTEQALALLAGESMPAVHVLGLTETRISLIRKRKRGEMTADEVQRTLSELGQMIADGTLTVVPQPVGLWDEAVRIAENVAVHLRTADALHAAWAKLSGYTLATFDDDLAIAARAEGVSVRS
jgi:uncharacterized protein